MKKKIRPEKYVKHPYVVPFRYCKECGTRIPIEESWSYRLRKMVFCSKECLNSRVKKMR